MAARRGWYRLQHSSAAIRADEFQRIMSTYCITVQDRIGIAVSGGSDSMALLRLTVEWQQRISATMPLFVISVDHNLRPEAAEEVKLVSDQCAIIQTQSPISVVHVPLKLSLSAASISSSKLQSKAREARFEAFAEACIQHQVKYLLVAHNLNDQVETFLLRFARASGIAGLSCMQPISCSNCTERFGQLWIEDPSNQNMAFDRVRARSVVSRLPAELLCRISRTASHMSQLSLYSQHLTHQIIFLSCTWVYPLSSCWVNLNRLRQESSSVARNVLVEIFKIVSREPAVSVKSLSSFIEYIYQDSEVVLGSRQMFGCRIQRFPESLLIMPDYSRLQSKLRSQLKRRNYWERLPSAIPAYMRHAELVAIVSASSGIIALPALSGINLHIRYSWRPEISIGTNTTLDQR